MRLFLVYFDCFDLLIYVPYFSGTTVKWIKFVLDFEYILLKYQDSSKTMSLYVVRVILLVSCSQLICVSAFAAFAPESDDVIGDDYDDILKPESHPIQDAPFYKMLSKILMSYLNRLQQRDLIEGYLSKTDTPYYRTSKRNSEYTGLIKRKVFWQPLGYNRVGTGSSRSGEQKTTSDNGRGQVFRYG